MISPADAKAFSGCLRFHGLSNLNQEIFSGKQRELNKICQILKTQNKTKPYET